MFFCLHPTVWLCKYWDNNERLISMCCSESYEIHTNVMTRTFFLLNEMQRDLMNEMFTVNKKELKYCKKYFIKYTIKSTCKESSFIHRWKLESAFICWSLLIILITVNGNNNQWQKIMIYWNNLLWKNYLRLK